MKVENVIENLKKDCYIDSLEIFCYASEKRILGGAVGAATGPVLLSVYHGILYVHRAKLDNTYADCLYQFKITDLQNIRGKAGLFGGRFSFEYEGEKYKFQLPSRANKFVEYFCQS